jgi:hypothetical protein
MWLKKLFAVDTILQYVRNIVVKIIPENSWFFKQMTLIGLKINAKKCHLPLTITGNGDIRSAALQP